MTPLPLTPPIRRILCAVDFARQSKAAARYAAMLAERTGARLGLAHIIGGAPDLYRLAEGGDLLSLPEHETLMEDWLSEAQLQLDELSADLPHPSDRNIVGHGVVVPTLIECATDFDADLLVVGSHGRGWFERALLGSVSEGLVREALMPVTVVRIAATLPGPARPVVCGVDFSPASIRAATWAARQAESLDAPLHLVHVLPHLDRLWMPLEAAGLHQPQLDDVAIMETLRSRLAQIARRLPGDVVAVIERGGETDRLLAAAERLAASSIVVGSHGRSGFARARIGTVAQRLVRHAPITVTVVRAPPLDWPERAAA